MVELADPEAIRHDVSLYSVLCGVFLILVFVVPCILFALLSKYCQKQTIARKKSCRYSREEDASGVLRQSMELFLKQSTDFGSFGQLDISVDSIDCVERIVSVKSSLSCVDTWKAYAPKALSSGDMKWVTVMKLTDPKNAGHMNCLGVELGALSPIPPHSHLLNLLAVCMSSGPPSALILEYPPYGTLHSFLFLKARARTVDHLRDWLALEEPVWQDEVVWATNGGLHKLSQLLADPAIRSKPFKMPLTEPFSPLDEMLFAIQIASAMEHLIHNKVFHKHLSTENVVIAADFTLKLTGIGLDIPSFHHSGSTPRIKRTLSGRNLMKWDAPEVLEKSGLQLSLTQETEVWRYGMTLWEVVSLADTPFADIPSRDLVERMKRGERPRRPEGCSEEIYNVMSRCWALRPDDRPTFCDIIKDIRRFLKSYVGRKSKKLFTVAASVAPRRPFELLSPTGSNLESPNFRGRPTYGSFRYKSSRSNELILLHDPIPSPEHLPEGYAQTDV